MKLNFSLSVYDNHLWLHTQHCVMQLEGVWEVVNVGCIQVQL